MTATALTAAPAQSPDPNQDQAQPDSRARTTRLRRVLGKLIAHGKDLAEVLTRPRRPGAMAIVWVSVRFGTKDIALILARVTRGLRLAMALNATLPKEPPPKARPARTAPAERKSRARPGPQPRNNQNLITLPTSREIAALLRDRPVGEVLTEICLDLGILTVETFWQDLESILLEHGADRDRIARDGDQRTARCNEILPPALREAFQLDPPSPPASSPAEAAPAATGPPE